MTFADYITYLSAVAPIFCAVAIGLWIRKANWLSEAADSSLLRLVINILVPALIFDSVAQNTALKDVKTALLSPVVGFTTVALGMGLALLVAKFLGKFLGLANRNSAGAFTLCIAIYSYNYMPLALAKTLFGSDVLGVLLVYNLGVEIFLWTFGLVLLGVTGAFRGWKQILNPPLVAVIIALLINLFNLNQYVPRFVLWTAGLIGQCAIPLGLIMLGATLADNWHELRLKGGARVMSAAVVLRLGLLPVVFLLAARFLPFPEDLKRALILQAAMPAAIVPLLPMVRHYGSDAPTAMRVTLVTVLLSLVTMPLWILFGLYFCGLLR